MGSPRRSLNGYNFTDRVRKGLQLAREEAARPHYEFVRTEHILLRLIREGEEVAAAVLTNLNAMFDRYDVIDEQDLAPAALCAAQRQARRVPLPSRSR